MCGIAGIVAPGGLAPPGLLETMRDVLVHRGPDDHGSWVNPERTVGLASRRLAILDLSPSGHQPMVDDEAGLALTFNGEIYNFVELRAELQTRGHRFRGRSDTEVLLHAYREWGHDCLAHLNGMFAFAVWDSRRGELFAARDRFGEKPFYYCATADAWLFASEIKALLAYPGAPRRCNLAVLRPFLETGQLPDGTQETFFAGIHQLPAAHALTLRPGESPRFERYWDLDPSATVEYANDADYAEALRHLLTDSVRCRLRSDVPVGSCLSGGLDSSSVVGLIATLPNGDGPARQTTFSARYADAATDEGPYIRAVVAQAGVEAHEVWPSANGLADEVERWTWHQEEPCPTTSAYAQWKVMQLARQQGVAVLLDGQGADEILAGYQPPAYGYRYAGLLRQGRVGELVREFSSFQRRHGRLTPAVRYLGVALLPDSVRGGLRARHHRGQALLAGDLRTTAPAESGRVRGPAFRTPLKTQLYEQLTRTSLPGLLRFADRNSMAFSVEVRLPFLDHRLVEFAFAVPERVLVSGGLTKVLLREAMRPVLPPADRPRAARGRRRPALSRRAGPRAGVAALHQWPRGRRKSLAGGARRAVAAAFLRERMKIVSVVGARPQFVKAATVSRALRVHHTEVLVHTGQHYDPNMSAIFFEQLELPEPDYHLGVGSGAHGWQTGEMLRGLEQVLLRERPDWAVVYGDTNSTLAGALAAAKLQLRVAHVEAGLRSYNRRMPEEINRVLTDHISAVLFCPTDQAVRNLAAEGITAGVHQVGDVMYETAFQYAERADRALLQRLGLEAGSYALATIHRAENVDDSARLALLMTALNLLELPTVFPVHPRTRGRLERLAFAPAPHLRLIDPVGYPEMLRLEQEAQLILTDSGGVQKEAYIFGVPCLTLRDETEWVETVAAGWNRLVGTDPAQILAAARAWQPPALRPALFGDGRTTARILGILETRA
jgi:asparagine synthase (glutamine-hydrolysing)/UDP-N-acetylglucosamine 2-epimerase